MSIFSLYFWYFGTFIARKLRIFWGRYCYFCSSISLAYTELQLPHCAYNFSKVVIKVSSSLWAGLGGSWLSILLYYYFFFYVFCNKVLSAAWWLLSELHQCPQIMMTKHHAHLKVPDRLRRPARLTLKREDKPRFYHFIVESRSRLMLDLFFSFFSLWAV